MTTFLLVRHGETDAVGKSIYFSEQNVLDEKAQKLTRLKGSLRLEYVLESRKVATLERHERYPATLMWQASRFRNAASFSSNSR